MPNFKTQPTLVRKLCFGFSAWIVGSAVSSDNPRDYDVAIPYQYWREAALILPKDAKPNNFGGWKCISDGKEVDVWPFDLHEFVLIHPVKELYHPMSGIHLTKSIK